MALGHKLAILLSIPVFSKLEILNFPCTLKSSGEAFKTITVWVPPPEILI